METTTLDPSAAPAADAGDAGVEAGVDVRAAVIDELLAAGAAVQAGELQQVWMALQWAHLHPAPVDADGVVSDYAGWGDLALLVPDSPGREVTPLVPIAGPGAPLVSPLAALELGASLGRSHDHARQLLGDALELVHRLPRLWQLCQEGRVPVWLARQISRETHDLSFDAVTHADKLICAVPDKVAAVDARRLVHEARLHVDPDREKAEEEHAAARRGVWLRRDGRAPGVTDVNMTLDADHAGLLDATLNRVAADLRGLGDTSSRDERRATAVGVLADPQHALDLMSGRSHDTAVGTAGTGGDVDLVVHLTDTDLTDTDLSDEHGVAVEERRGAVSATQLAAWIRRRATRGGRVRVRAVLHHGAPAADSCDTSVLARDWLTRHGIDIPVVTLRPIDLSDDTAVDLHDPPPLMHEQVVLRDAHCVFPGCRRDSRRCDLDHIEPYQSPDSGGPPRPPRPPGQTRASNLAPLCRRHHNAKTHHDWHYRRRDDGSYDWLSPTGHAYTVVPHSRAPLAHH